MNTMRRTERERRCVRDAVRLFEKHCGTDDKTRRPSAKPQEQLIFMERVNGLKCRIFFGNFSCFQNRDTRL